MAGNSRGAVHLVGSAARATLRVPLLSVSSDSLERKGEQTSGRSKSSLVGGSSRNDVRGGSPLLGGARTASRLFVIVCQQPNKRLKLPPPVICGRLLFLMILDWRRSLAPL